MPSIRSLSSKSQSIKSYRRKQGSAFLTLLKCPTKLCCTLLRKKRVTQIFTSRRMSVIESCAAVPANLNPNARLPWQLNRTALQANWRIISAQASSPRRTQQTADREAKTWKPAKASVIRKKNNRVPWSLKRTHLVSKVMMTSSSSCSWGAATSHSSMIRMLREEMTLRWPMRRRTRKIRRRMQTG